MPSRTSHFSRYAVLLVGALLAAILVYHFTGYDRRLSNAVALLEQWDLVEAEANLRELAEQRPADPDARRFYAECLLRRGELRAAQREFTTLCTLDSARFLSHSLSLATVHFYLGNLDSASYLANECFVRARFQGNGTTESGALGLLGRIAFNRAQYDTSLVLQRRSLELARSAGSQLDEANALRQLGVLCWYEGEPDSARSVYYEAALNIYRRLNDRIGEATTLNNIALAGGGVHYRLEAFAIRKKIGDQIGLADSYYFVTGGGLNHWFDLMYALRKKSLEISRRIGYTWGEDVAARAVEDMVVAAYDSINFERDVVDTTDTIPGELAIQRMLRRSSDLVAGKRLREAADLRKRIVDLCDSMGYTIGLEQALALHVLTLISIGEYTKAERVAHRLQRVWKNAPIEATYFLARVYLASGRMGKAAQLTRSLIQQLDAEYLARLARKDTDFQLASAQMLVLRYDLYSILFHALKGKATNEEMYRFLERFRSLPLGFGVEPAYRTGRPGNAVGDNESIWHRYIRLLKEIESGSDAVDRSLREFSDAYHRAVQRNAQATASAQRLYGTSLPAMGDVQRALRKNQILVEYFVGKEKTYALALRTDSSFFLELNQPSANVNSSARTLRELLLRGKSSPIDSLWKNPASFLFQALIQPVADRGFLRRNDHLIVSPHGRLLEIPFACLLAPNDSLLIQQFSLSYILSAGHVLDSASVRQHPTLLALVPDRESLPFSEKEVKGIPAGLFSSNKILVGDDATTSALLSQASTSDVIHIAAHGAMHRWNPLFSHLKLGDTSLELHRVLGMSLSSRLVVLSACESGFGIGMMGEVSEGHEVVSFPRAFLSAGASAVIAPLWVVEDEATSQMMTGFYAALASSHRSDTHWSIGAFATSLTAVQRQFIDNSSKTRSKSHPFYWAGFYLTGNPN